jgi:hypothetical protein
MKTDEEPETTLKYVRVQLFRILYLVTPSVLLMHTGTSLTSELLVSTLTTEKRVYFTFTNLFYVAWQ